MFRVQSGTLCSFPARSALTASERWRLCWASLSFALRRRAVWSCSQAEYRKRFHRGCLRLSARHRCWSQRRTWACPLVFCSWRQGRRLCPKWATWSIEVYLKISTLWSPHLSILLCWKLRASSEFTFLLFFGGPFLGWACHPLFVKLLDYSSLAIGFYAVVWYPCASPPSSCACIM